MLTIGRLKSGELMLSGKINERIPSYTDKLVAHYPFDYTLHGEDSISSRNLLNITQWRVGTSGTQGDFIMNGSESENQIINYINPWGVQDTIWATLQNDSVDGPDGGWNVNNRVVDNTKTYRLTIWIRREDVGNGITYFGPQNETVSDLGSTTSIVSPFFISGNISTFPRLENEWLLFVAHIRPHDHPDLTIHPDTGIYDTSGNKIYNNLIDFKWLSSTMVSGHRVYLYNSTSINEKQFLFHPRMEMLTNTSPSILQLITGIENVINVNNPTNVTFLPEGLAMYPSTTNLLRSPLFAGGSATFDTSEWVSWVGDSGDASRVTVAKKNMYSSIYEGAHSQSIYIKSQGNTSDQVLSQQFTTTGFSVGNTLTVSAYMKTNVTGKLLIQVAFLDNLNAEVSVRATSSSVSKTNEFQRITLTFTVPPNTTKLHVMFRGITLVGEFMEVLLPQLENSPFATAPCVSSRGNPICKIPFGIARPFTIHIEFTPSVSNSYNSNVINIFNGDSITSKIVLWKRTTENTYRLRYNNANDFVLPSNSVNNTKINRITIAVDVSQTTVYIDGNLFETKATDSAATMINELDLVSWDFIPNPIPCVTIHSLSIFKKVLTTVEVKKLVSSTTNLKFSSVGSINASLVEGPINLPSDAYYWPLGDSTLDKNGIFDAVASDNMTFSNGYAWTCMQATQLFTLHENTSSYSIKTGNNFETMVFEDRMVLYKHKFAGELNNHKGMDVSVSSGITYFFKTELFVSEDYNGNYNSFARIENSGATVFNYDITRKGAWQTVTHSFTPGANGTSRILLAPANSNNSATKGHIIYKNPMLVAVGHELPFHRTLIPRTMLEYNLHDTIGLNWNTNWSIVYWKIPKGTTIFANLTGYSIDSLGVNSNTVGGGYRWWGKDNSLNNVLVNGSPGQAFNPSDFFNKPHMISIVRNGSNITWKFFGIGGIIYTFTQSVTISVANFFVCQHGYDLKLGGFNSTSESNSMFKDLIVVKRALTDTEVENLYKIQMRFKSNKLFISGQLSDGCVF